MLSLKRQLIMTLNPWYLSLFFLLTYLLSAIPFSVLVTKIKQIDLRGIGSGNIGATNVYRAMGIRYAVLVFLLDAVKGGLPTYIIQDFTTDPWIHMVIGLTAIIGHSLSCFVKFKGGKGVATGVGVLFALSPKIAAIVCLIAFIIIKFTRYVALASIVCACTAPILFFVMGYPQAYSYVLSIIAIFITIRHKGNINRLLSGTENKI